MGDDDRHSASRPRGGIVSADNGVRPELPRGLDLEGGALSQKLSAWARRSNTNAARAVVEAEARLLNAFTERDKAKMEFELQAAKATYFQEIADDDYMKFKADAARSEYEYEQKLDDLDELAHRRETARDRREAERIEAKIDLLRKKKQLEELESPSKPPDNKDRLQQLSTEISRLTTQLSEESISDDLRDYLTKERRRLQNEHDILMGGE